MIESTRGKKKPEAVPAIPAGLLDAIGGILDERKLKAILEAVGSPGTDVESLVVEIKALRETIERNAVREWEVEISRDKKGGIEKLTYRAVGLNMKTPD